ncbi:MAG: hypothetical protein AAFN77_07015 [Planctomycetota bacterium]
MATTKPFENDFLDLVAQANVKQVRKRLPQDPELAKTNFKPDSLHTDGFPL